VRVKGLLQLAKNPAYHLRTKAQVARCVFPGYSNCHNEFIRYDQGANKFCIFRNVFFFENQLFFLSDASNNLGSISLHAFDHNNLDEPNFQRPPILHVYQRRPLMSPPDLASTNDDS
jgi:hypothetical protein